MCPELNSLPSTSYPFLFLPPCVLMSIPRAQLRIIKSLTLCPCFLNNQNSLIPFRHVQSVVPVHHSWFISWYPRTLSVSVRRTSHESPYQFHVFPISFKIFLSKNKSFPFLLLYYLLLFRDLVYMVILEPSGYFSSRSKGSFFKFTCHFNFIFSIDRTTNIFFSPLVANV